MSSAIVAFGACSGLGRGLEAFSGGPPGSAARVVTIVDDELVSAGLARPFCARAAGVDRGGDRATALLTLALGDCMGALDGAGFDWRSLRVGLALGTSSGGMREAERLFATLAGQESPNAVTAKNAAYFSPMTEAISRSGLSLSPSTLVLTACAASTLALGLATRWLEIGACDVVLAGGFDAVSVFVASGFEALGATTARLPSRPFALDRDGMALGEGAAVIALMRAAEAPRALAFITGFGASGDAVHVTAPDRSGEGLARAARLALAEAGLPPVALVSAHATATPFNDAAESRAIAAALGDAAREVVVHPFKAQIGHTLGAAGALESLACVDAIVRGVLPASVISESPDPAAPARLLVESRAASVTCALKLSAAFGGANAALVFESRVGQNVRRAPATCHVSRAFHVSRVPTANELAGSTGQSADRLAKSCDLSRLALAAVAMLSASFGDLRGAGIVVGHAYATLDVNEQYNRRLLARGARAVEARKFPYTSPNAAAGECSVAFGLTGPNLAVGSGLHGGLEALVIASHLVAARDAARIVVVAVDAPGPAAIALAAAAGWPLPPLGAVALVVSADARDGAYRIASATLASRGATAGASAP